jgi:hypothetical protein
MCATRAKQATTKWTTNAILIVMQIVTTVELQINAASAQKTTFSKTASACPAAKASMGVQHATSRSLVQCAKLATTCAIVHAYQNAL